MSVYATWFFYALGMANDPVGSLARSVSGEFLYTPDYVRSVAARIISGEYDDD